MVGLNGVIFRNLITGERFSSNEAFVVSTTIFVVYLVMTFFIILTMLFISSHQRKRDGMMAQKVTFAEPIPLDRRQRTNVWLIGVFVVILLVPPILHLCMPHNSAVTWVNSRVDVSLFAILFAIVCALMRVGEEKESLLHVPWSTLIMIGGMGMLVSIAVKAGTISLLAGWVGHTPRLLIPVVLCFLAAVLNMFGGSFEHVRRQFRRGCRPGSVPSRGDPREGDRHEPGAPVHEHDDRWSGHRYLAILGRRSHGSGIHRQGREGRHVPP